MIFSYSDIVLKNTNYANRQKLVMPLGKGIIYKIEIQFPLGCGGLANCCINRSLTQLWPSNSGAGFSSDGFVISFDEVYELLYAPFELELYTWNLSTTYDHTITVRIGLTPKSGMLLYVLPQTIRLLNVEKGIK